MNDLTGKVNFLNKIGVFRKWDVLLIDGEVAPSPSWKSTRRSIFMTTETEELDPWFFAERRSVKGWRLPLRVFVKTWWQAII